MKKELINVKLLYLHIFENRVWMCAWHMCVLYTFFKWAKTLLTFYSIGLSHVKSELRPYCVGAIKINQMVILGCTDNPNEVWMPKRILHHLVSLGRMDLVDYIVGKLYIQCTHPNCLSNPLLLLPMSREPIPILHANMFFVTTIYFGGHASDVVMIHLRIEIIPHNAIALLYLNHEYESCHSAYLVDWLTFNQTSWHVE